MLRNRVIDDQTGERRTGSPLGADIVDVVIRADVYGKDALQVGAVYLYAGTLAAAHCKAWMGVTGGPTTASAVLTVQDLDTGENLMTLTKKGTPGSAGAVGDLVVPEPGWYALWLRSTNLKATAAVFGIHLAFQGAV